MPEGRLARGVGRDGPRVLEPDLEPLRGAAGPDARGARLLPSGGGPAVPGGGGMNDTSLRIGLIGSVRFPQRPPFAGGLEAHTWMLAEGLRDRGHHVDRKSTRLNSRH